MGFTGVDDPYEPPVEPEITLQGYGSSPDENARRVMDYLVSQGYLGQ
jgi:adenylylsulfate kinase-like enzyme